jgi:RNA polymerase sigma factor (TIGR02999 family)
MNEPRDVTSLLADWQQGESGALDELSPYIYGELKRIAQASMRGEGAGHTLQPTGLVNEAFIRLVGGDFEYPSRSHFFALAAGMMRRILVDHARGRRREKRGGGVRNLTLDEAAHADDYDDRTVIEVDEALTRLAAQDARMAQAVELVYFGGLTYEQSATVLGVSRGTVANDLKFAKAWLRNELQD